jgi:hypothetical protein
MQPCTQCCAAGLPCLALVPAGPCHAACHWLSCQLGRGVCSRHVSAAGVCKHTPLLLLLLVWWLKDAAALPCCCCCCCCWPDWARTHAQQAGERLSAVIAAALDVVAACNAAPTPCWPSKSPCCSYTTPAGLRSRACCHPTVPALLTCPACSPPAPACSSWLVARLPPSQLCCFLWPRLCSCCCSTVCTCASLPNLHGACRPAAHRR